MLQSHFVATLVLGVGYIGSRLVQDLLYEGREVVGFDNYFSTDRRAIDGFARSPAFRFIEGSILDAAALERAFDAVGNDLEGVFLLAAQASAHPDAAPNSYTEEVNLRGPRLVVEALTSRRVEAPIIYGSSLRVHGSPLPPIVDEATPMGVFTDLAHLSKCYVEKLLEMFAATRDVTSRVVRLGLTYGVSPVMKVDRKFMTAPNLFCLQAATGERLEVQNGDAIGFIHVDDAARSLRWALDYSSKTRYTVMVAPAEISTVGDVADLVRLAGEARELVVEVARPAEGGDSGGAAPVLRSTMSASGFESRRRLDEGIAETLDHFLVRHQ